MLKRKHLRNYHVKDGVGGLGSEGLCNKESERN